MSHPRGRPLPTTSWTDRTTTASRHASSGSASSCAAADVQDMDGHPGRPARARRPGGLTAIIEVAPAVAGWVPPEAGPIQRAVLRLDDRAVRPARESPVAGRSRPRPGRRCRRIDLTRVGARHRDAGQDRGELATRGLDIIIQPVGRPVVALAAYARHGVWGFEHGGSGEPAMAPGVAAVLGGHDTLRSELVAVRADGRRAVLARTWSAPDATSVRRFMDHVLAKMAAYPARVVARLARQPDATHRRPRHRALVADRVESPPYVVGGDRSSDRPGAARARRPGWSGACRSESSGPARWLLAEIPDVPEDVLPDPWTQPVQTHPPTDRGQLGRPVPGRP